MAMRKTVMMDVGSMGPDLWPHTVVNEIQKVMEQGTVKYRKAPWLEQTTTEHLKHAMHHLTAIRRMASGKPGPNDADEDHLAHAFTRLMMAVAVNRGYTKTKGDDNA